MHPSPEHKSEEHPFFYLLAGAAGLGTLAFVFLADNPVRNAYLTATRTTQKVIDAVNSVDPEHNPDLQPGANGGAVWCNKALYLILRKLGVVLPWGQWGTRVNDLISWVAAGNDGWYPVSQDEAQQVAVGNGIAIATYFNPVEGHSGHAAIVLPYDGPMQIAQAGASNFNQGDLTHGFGALPVQFFAHA